MVQTGTAVDFPNSDQVRHQVYSFSEAKNFQLALYAGERFRKSGAAALGTAEGSL